MNLWHFVNKSATMLDYRNNTSEKYRIDIAKVTGVKKNYEVTKIYK